MANEEAYLADDAADATSEQGLGYAPLPDLGMHDPELIRWQQDPNDPLLNFKRQLKGYERDEIAGKWKKNSLPLMTDGGIHEIMTLLYGTSHHISVMSNYSKDEINNLCFEFSARLTQWLALNQQKFKIDKRMLNFIKYGAFNLVYPIFKRAEKAGDRDYSSGVLKIGETFLRNQQNKNQQQWKL